MSLKRDLKAGRARIVRICDNYLEDLSENSNAFSDDCVCGFPKSVHGPKKETFSPLGRQLHRYLDKT